MYSIIQLLTKPMFDAPTVRINWQINSISDLFEILWWLNCDLIKSKDLLVIIMGSDNKIR